MRRGIDWKIRTARAVDLATGSVVQCAAGGGMLPRRDDGAVWMLVVARDGAMAWTGARWSEESRSLVMQVVTCDGDAETVLDEGLGIDPASLARHGRRLSWRHDGAPRTGTLP